MINILGHYIWRSIMDYGEEGVDLPIEKILHVFQTNPNLEQKVAGEKLLPYYGNTVVFLLEESLREALQECQKTLYEKVGWMLAEPLNPDTFHMTLHDLVNGPEENDRLLEQMERSEEKAKALIQQWQDQPPLSMLTTWMFNMVDTSIVLGLAPADEDSWRRLDEMYMALEEVVPLNRALTPHITMAYYRPGSYTVYDMKCLKQALEPVERKVQLNMKDLVLQTFTDMNSYKTV